VSGNYAYIATGGAGTGNSLVRFEIINVANPSSPYKVGAFEPPARVTDIAVANNQAYLAEHQHCPQGNCNPAGGGLRIVNITNPYYPYQTGWYNGTFQRANAVAIWGSYAYVAAGNNGLRILDVSTPWSIQEAGHYQEDDGHAIDLVLSGNLAFVANGMEGLLVLYFSQNLALTTNYSIGAPGSVFRLTGTNFLFSKPAEITVNNHLIGTVTTDENGDLSILLDTSEADAGAYFVKVATGPIDKTVNFVLDHAQPIRPQEGSGTILSIPDGIAFPTNFHYIPIILR